jgi:hypothetical protein
MRIKRLVIRIAWKQRLPPVHPSILIFNHLFCCSAFVPKSKRRCEVPDFAPNAREEAGQVGGVRVRERRHRLGYPPYCDVDLAVLLLEVRLFLAGALELCHLSLPHEWWRKQRKEDGWWEFGLF